jgi:hypothetical protein
VRIAFIISLTLILSSCGGNAGKSAAKLPNIRCHYEPEVITLKGKISRELFWGPPSYGEDTLIDLKERVYIFYPENALDLEADSSFEFNIAQKDVEALQLVIDSIPPNLLETTITAKGTLFGAHTGHHFTKALMNVSDIK